MRRQIANYIIMAGIVCMSYQAVTCFLEANYFGCFVFSGLLIGLYLEVKKA